MSSITDFVKGLSGSAKQQGYESLNHTFDNRHNKTDMQDAHRQISQAAQKSAKSVATGLSKDSISSLTGPGPGRRGPGM